MIQFRKRHLLLLIGFIITPIIFILTSPENPIIKMDGAYAELATYLVYLMRAFLVMGLLHLIRKAMLDYPSADFAMLLKKAVDDKQAGLAAMAVAIMMLGISIVFAVVIMPGG